MPGADRHASRRGPWRRRLHAGCDADRRRLEVEVGSALDACQSDLDTLIAEIRIAKAQIDHRLSGPSWVQTGWVTTGGDAIWDNPFAASPGPRPAEDAVRIQRIWSAGTAVPHVDL